MSSILTKQEAELEQELTQLPSQLRSMDLSILKFKTDRQIVQNELTIIESKVTRHIISMSATDPNLNSETKRRSKIQEVLESDKDYLDLTTKLNALNKEIDALYIELNYLDRKFKAIRSQVQLRAVSQ